MNNPLHDIIIIGSGPGGYRAAVLAALRGLKVAIIEKQQWGGCCLNRGCVPKKDWYHSARMMAASQQFAGRGIDGRLQGDLGRAWQHQQQVVERVRDSYLNYLQRLGVSRYEGHGRLLSPSRVQVDGNDRRQILTAKHIILATGASPSYPTGFEPVVGKVLDTDMLFSVPLPAGNRVAVLGGGVVGCELAYILHQFGKQVTWFSRREPLAGSEFTPQARLQLQQAFTDLELVPRQQTPSALVVADDGVRLSFADGETETVDWLLLATGRTPHTEELGLEQTRVVTDSAGFIVRNAYLQTDEPSIYAIGDCTSAQMTANQALADATVAVHNIVQGNDREQAPQCVPQAIYSAVEMARVGMNDDQAEDEGFEPAVGFAAFETSPRALGQDEADGFVRVLADMDSGAFLGGEIIGAEAGELIHLLAAASDADQALKSLARLAYNHPSRSEELLNAIETMASKWGMGEFIFDD